MIITALNIERAIRDALGSNEEIIALAKGIAAEHDRRVTELIRANSATLILRRLYKARFDTLYRAANRAEEHLVDFLTENTEEVFEELPEIDDARTVIVEAIEATFNLKASDYGRP